MSKAIKIALDAGHFINTPGKRTPNGIREWTLNNRVLLGFKNEIEKYKNVSIVRLDDPSGKKETTLTARTNKAKREKCDVLISFHHNAFQSKWGNHGGSETWIYAGRKSEKLGQALQDAIVSTLKLRNRGVKFGNMHMNREVPFPSALVEIGFMDSNTDHDVIIKESNSNLVGKNMAIAFAKLYGLDKIVDKPIEKPIEKPNVGLSVGNKVKIKSSAKKYSTGQNIPNSYKGKAYTIQQVGSGKVLIKELYSWVNNIDVELVGSKPIEKPVEKPKPKDKYVKVGGLLTLYKRSTGSGKKDYYGRKYQTLQYRNMKVLAEANGRVQVSTEGIKKANGKPVFDRPNFWVEANKVK